ncbi:MAG: hypothetical protein ACUVR8_06060 [Acidobacteriota bacterium]
MPPTVWCPQHAARFPFHPESEEQTCPAGHNIRFEGIVGYCPSCDLQWDAHQVEQPDTCPYCQASNVRRYLCHTCLRLTYLPTSELTTSYTTCPGCRMPLAQTAHSHACRVLRVEFATGRQICPACQETIQQHLPTSSEVAKGGTNDKALTASPVVASDAQEKQITESEMDDVAGIHLTQPVRARALHATYGAHLVRVHFDYNLRRFFRNEKGLFYAYGLGTPPRQYHIIPSWSRFGVAGDFIHWFSAIFDCSQPKGGDIWVHTPAIADAEGTLLRKGLLEIDRPPEEPPRPWTGPSPEATVEQAGGDQPYRSSLPLTPRAVDSPVKPAAEFTASTVNQPLVATTDARQRNDSPIPPGPPAKRPPRWGRWLWMLLGLLLLSAIGVWVYLTSSHLAKPPSVGSESPAPGPRPNQPQATNQTNQEAILAVLEGASLAFNSQQLEAYTTYLNRTLRPYGRRREAAAKEVIDELRKLSETYTVTMGHEVQQIEVDTQGRQAMVKANRTLSGHHRQTGQVVQDRQYVTYRFIKQGSFWLIAGIAPPATLSFSTDEPKHAPGKSQR